jgi:hypothetical protein
LSLTLRTNKLHCARILEIPYFIEYNVHTIIVRTWISQWFLAIFFNNNFTRLNHCKFIHHKKPS